MLSRSPNQRGVTLVELLVGIAVGMLVVVGSIAIYVGTSKAGREIILANRYNQDMRAVMDIMVADLRRAGYSAVGSGVGSNPFTERTTSPTDIFISADRRCILFAYDTTWRSAGGTAGPDAGFDFAGFRLNDDGVVQAVRSTTMASTALDCGNLAWEALTDARVINATELRFDLLGSTCTAGVPADYQPTAGTTYSSWSVVTDTTVPPCDSTHPDAPSSYPDPTTHVFTEVRRINIRMEAQTNAANPVAREPLQEGVIVRNHRILLP